MTLSIKNRLTLWYIASFVVIINLFSAAIYLGFRSISLSNIDSSLLALAKGINADFYEEGGKNFQLDEDELKEYPLYPLSVVIIKQLDPSDFVTLATTKNLAGIEPLLHYLKQSQGKPAFYTVNNQSKTDRMLIFQLYKKRHFLLALYPLDKINRLGALLLRLLFIIEGAILLIVFLWGKILINRIFVPIRRIIDRAMQINAENLSERIPTVHSRDEIGDLITTLNRMFDRLDQSFSRIKQFSDDVAHELKTPVTALRGEIEVLLRKKRTNDNYEKALRELLKDTAKLDALIENMLLISRMESRSFQYTFKPFSLDNTLLEVCDQKLRDASHKNIKLNIQDVPEIRLNGNAFLIKRMLSNILDNAIKYSPDNTNISVSLKNDVETTLICIKDSGIGIPESALPRLFERFYRVDDSRTRETGGTGLGLAIADTVAKLHKGTIKVESRLSQGTKVCVSLPIRLP